MDSRRVGAEVDPKEIQAILQLKGLPGVGDRSIANLIREQGSGVKALRAAQALGLGRGRGRRGDPRTSGGTAEVAGATSSGPPAPADWVRQGIEVLPMSSPRFPPLLLELSDPPPLLFLQGQTDLLSRPAVAIVGSRKATETGRRVSETVARILAEAGVAVVSGMARGIDGAAHRGALSGGGKTLGVLGSGIGVIYPSCNRPLFKDVADRGLLVSEFLPGEGARAHHFPKRNRIIAAMARAVVVVEAGERSGALITVDHALDLGREIFAVPGSLENPQARSSNLLLRDGARPLIRPESILEEIEHLFPEGFSGGGGAEGSVSVSSEVPSEFRALWEILRAEPRGIGDLAREAGVAPEEALSGLSVLELGGWVVQCPGMRFQRR